MTNFKSVVSYELNALTLYNYRNEKVDINELFEEINIYEDLFNNTITADIVILDARGFYEEFPIIGEETLILEYTKSGDRTVSLNFRLYKISDFGYVKNNVVTYKLHFVSSEYITNLQKKVSKSYTGLISNTVEKIYNEYISSGKQILIEPTKQIKRLVIPNLSPFETINWLASLAIPEVKNASNYIFYEDIQGFKFLTISSLLTKKVTVEYNYRYTDVLKLQAADNLEKPDDQYTVLSVKTNKIFDIMKNINSGVYGSELLSVDPIRRKYQTFKHDYLKDFDKYLHVDNYKMVSEVTDLISTQSKSKMIVGDYDRNQISHLTSKQEQIPLNREYTLLQRQLQLNEISNGQTYTIIVPGESQRRVGDIVELNTSSFMIDNQNNLNRLSSGRYLIIALRHTLKQEEYTMSMEIVKDGYNTKFS